MGTIPKLEDVDVGFYNVEYNVTIAVEETETVTKGGIILTDRQKETEGLASVRGRLVAASPLAFTYDDWPEGSDHLKPRVGDEVIFAKYAGILVSGKCGRELRVCKDKDIMAVINRAEV